MCCIEHTSQLDKCGVRVAMWPVSPVEHLGRRPSANCRAPGWLAKHLTRLSRPQVREARPTCCIERTSQLDKCGVRVAMWPVSPVGHPGRRPSASCRAPGWLARHLSRSSRPQVREARPKATSMSKLTNSTKEFRYLTGSIRDVRSYYSNYQPQIQGAPPRDVP
jgi:hypothetical protein